MTADRPTAAEERASAPPRYPEPDADGLHEPAAGPPRWVRMLLIVAAVLVLALVVALHLSGAVGPGAH